MKRLKTALLIFLVLVSILSFVFVNASAAYMTSIDTHVVHDLSDVALVKEVLIKVKSLICSRWGL